MVNQQVVFGDWSLALALGTATGWPSPLVPPRSSQGRARGAASNARSVFAPDTTTGIYRDARARVKSLLSAVITGCSGAGLPDAKASVLVSVKKTASGRQNHTRSFPVSVLPSGDTRPTRMMSNPFRQFKAGGTSASHVTCAEKRSRAVPPECHLF
jgi:hypothetical protein